MMSSAVCVCVTQLVLSSTWSTNNLQADPVSPESDLRVGDEQFTDVFRRVTFSLLQTSFSQT